MNNIHREQAKDAFYVKQKRGIYSSRRECFLDDEDVMYNTPDRQQTPVGGAEDLNPSYY